MHERSAGYWDSEAESFDAAADHGLQQPAAREAWRALLAAAMPAPPGRVADLGCGTGTLSLLLADMGYVVDGVDFSPSMLEQARRKACGRDHVTFHLGDAADPPLLAHTHDVVLSRHVLWAMPDPAGALRRWLELLALRGRLVLIEGRWHTGAGIAADDLLELLSGLDRNSAVTSLHETALWGGAISDERYMIVSDPA